MILVATGNGLRDVDLQVHVDLEDERVTALARDDDGRWFAIVDRRRVLGGSPREDWEVLAESAGPDLTCLAAGSGRVLVGAEEAGLLEVRDGALAPVEAFGDAPGRDGWYTPWGGPPAVRSIAIAEDGAWYVNVHVGGILRSDDDGSSFTQLVDPDVDVHQVLVHGDLVVAACGAGGVMLSHDRGGLWETVTDGLHGTYCRAVAVSDAHVVVSASTGPRSERGAVYHRPLDRDVPFERCQLGLPEWFEGNVDTGWLHAVDDRIAFAAPGGRVYLSSDAGGTWMLVDGGLRDVAELVIAPDSGGDGEE